MQVKADLQANRNFCLLASQECFHRFSSTFLPFSSFPHSSSPWTPPPTELIHCESHRPFHAYFPCLRLGPETMSRLPLRYAALASHHATPPPRETPGLCSRALSQQPKDTEWLCREAKVPCKSHSYSGTWASAWSPTHPKHIHTSSSWSPAPTSELGNIFWMMTQPIFCPVLLILHLLSSLFWNGIKVLLIVLSFLFWPASWYFLKKKKLGKNSTSWYMRRQIRVSLLILLSSFWPHLGWGS